MNVDRLVCVSVALLALAGCKKKEAKLEPGDLPPDTVVVKVDDTPFTFADMDARAMGYLRYDREYQGIYFTSNMLAQAKAEYRKRAINTFVYTTLFLNEAARTGITLSEQDHLIGLQKFAYSLTQQKSSTNAYFNNGPHPPDVMRRDFHDSLLIERLLLLKGQQKLKVMNEEVEKGAEEIEAANAAKRATLETARKQILEGTPFEDIARAMSEDTASAKNGGDLGEFARGRSDPAFEEAAFRVPPGQVSDVVETRFGYHLIKVMAHNPAQDAKDDVPAVPETIRASHILVRTIPVDKAKVADILYRRKFIEYGRALYEELKGKAKIENAMFPDQKYVPLDSSK